MIRLGLRRAKGEIFVNARSLDERIEEMDLKIKRIEARKKALEARAKEQARKERTRRLIQIGAEMASIGMDTLAKATRLKHVVGTDPAFRQAFHQSMHPKEHPLDTDTEGVEE